MSETTSRIVEATFKAPALQISEWERHRSLITRLYKLEQKPLREVISILHEQHGFDASPRQYKLRIKAWNLNKNLKSEEREHLLRCLPKDQLHDAAMNPRHSTLMLNGRTLRPSVLQRYLRRTRSSQTPERCSPALSTDPQSEDSTYHAPLTTLPQAPSASPNNYDKLDPENIQLPSTLSFQPQTSLSVTSGARHASQSFHNHELGDNPSSLDFKHYRRLLTAKKHTTLSEEEDDVRRKRRRVPARNMISSTGTKALACPFYKHDPQRYSPQNDDINSAMRYRTCAGPGWESISRLRQHLFRAHVAAKHCRRCNLALHSRSDIKNHAQGACSDQLIDLNSSPETISETQQHQLEKKQLSSLPKEGTWLRIYHILFPHDSGIPSPYYQSDKERSNEATNASLPLKQPFPAIQQIDHLVQRLCTTLPDKVLNRLQGQPNAPGYSICTEALNAAAPQFAENTNQQPSQMQHEQHTGAHPCNTRQYSAAEQGLKSIISESVLETCSEWLRICREQDDSSDEEESEYENEQSRSSSSLANQQDLSLAPIETVPDPCHWYTETLTQGDRHLAADHWSQQIVDLSSQSARNLNTTAEALRGSSYMYPEGRRFTLPSAQPDLVPAGNFDGSAMNAPGGWLSSSMNLSADPLASWRQAQIPAGIATTLPDSNQDP